MKISVMCLMLFFIGIYQIFGSGSTESDSPQDLYSIAVNSIEGKAGTLAEYRGKILLIVNTASYCGYTGQYAGLEELYTRYKDRGLVVLAFPANNFLSQEPGTSEEIAEFCSLNYRTTFPLFEKISVAGSDIHPLYRFLTSRETNPDFSGSVTWNFNKFLVDGNGKVVARFDSAIEPLSHDVINLIDAHIQ